MDRRMLFSIVAFQCFVIPILLHTRRLAKRDPQRYRVSFIWLCVAEGIALFIPVAHPLGVFPIELK